MKICREFLFDSAHLLPKYKGKCEQMHGHTYKLEVIVEGEVGKDGMVRDFDELKRVVDSEIIEKLDHKNLNDILKIPTAENIAIWIFKRLKSRIKLHSVKLWEGQGKWVLIER